MNLKQEFCKKIDNDFGYDNEKLADNLIEIAKKHLKKQLIIGGVSISIARAEKYARMQHFLGEAGRDFVEWNDWDA